ncbi:Uncharacterized protein dnm_079110 [Desulfonema magnum]|uniref:Uncharacterized protein n=1 Tax=Desulfonema magnum TaxID=45655 RepID=A0A975BUZ9_9BACT|nr:Uncharacterized protein dnm_079110 [Desulfonema magnum]
MRPIGTLEKNGIFSSVPTGRNIGGLTGPGNELPGCFQESLRDGIFENCQLVCILAIFVLDSLKAACKY